METLSYATQPMHIIAKWHKAANHSPSWFHWANLLVLIKYIGFQVKRLLVWELIDYTV